MNPVPKAPEKPPGESTDSASRARLLVADDALCMQKILGCFLKRMRIDSEMAENGHVACQKAMRSLSKGQPYDVILMDIQMPQMNGKAAVRWLREHDWKGPILAVSALAVEENRDELMKLGCDGCVAKPVTEQKLREAVSQYVSCW